ncbi:MAG: hypothetical protein KDC35_05820 [Acidobacteria bacterium]|nr:hypothetical protein [Acidobacteriota bacterium]
MGRKSIWFRWFGWGCLPAKFRDALEQEHIRVIDEGVTGTVTLRQYRAPGRYCSYRKTGFIGALVITDQSFAAFRFRTPVLHLPLEPDQMKKLHVVQIHGRLLEISFQASEFDSKTSGSVTVRFNTDKAQAIKLALTRAGK